MKLTALKDAMGLIEIKELISRADIGLEGNSTSAQSSKKKWMSGLNEKLVYKKGQDVFHNLNFAKGEDEWANNRLNP
jgi:hypothetical protein